MIRKKRNKLLTNKRPSKRSITRKQSKRTKRTKRNKRSKRTKRTKRNKTNKRSKRLIAQFGGTAPGPPPPPPPPGGPPPPPPLLAGPAEPAASRIAAPAAVNVSLIRGEVEVEVPSTYDTTISSHEGIRKQHYIKILEEAEVLLRIMKKLKISEEEKIEGGPKKDRAKAEHTKKNYERAIHSIEADLSELKLNPSKAKLDNVLAYPAVELITTIMNTLLQDQLYNHPSSYLFVTTSDNAKVIESKETLRESLINYALVNAGHPDLDAKQNLQQEKEILTDKIDEYNKGIDGIITANTETEKEALDAAKTALEAAQLTQRNEHPGATSLQKKIKELQTTLQTLISKNTGIADTEKIIRKLDSYLNRREGDVTAEALAHQRWETDKRLESVIDPDLELMGNEVYEEYDSSDED
jgi:hypothetical protein